MSDVDVRFHENWLGLVQPVEGLVVSVPVLVDAQCMARQPVEVQTKLLALSPLRGDSRAIADLAAFFTDVLGHAPHTDVPESLCLFVDEGRKEAVRPAMTIRDGDKDVVLIGDVSPDLDLDKRPDAAEGWDYAPALKFDRLLRHTRVPIGILTNRRVVRLVYAPHGESSGSITFRVGDMCTVGGRPILDAMVMLLSATRFFGVAEDKALPCILEDSRKRQANVTNELAEQVLEAVQILLRGLEGAAERDKSSLLREAMEAAEADRDPVYGALLTVMLRLVFILYAEDWSLLPVDKSVWTEHYSLVGLFERLQSDAGAYPDSMARRFGAWSHLLALFRVIYLGASHRDLKLPGRRGHLFDPGRYPFLEGWSAGAPPINDSDARAAVAVPTVDDETVFRVLEKLIVFEGQRLSYRALDVEQLGSVYEALMGYRVVRLEHDAVALRVKNKSGAARAWVEVDELLRQPANRRVAWLEDTLGFDKATARKVAAATEVDALLELASRKKERARFFAPAGRLVLQPGPERRRTSSHYTPRSLSAPIVRRTLEPLLAVMGDAPPVERILNLKICDPAMGSGAFLVEACRFLGDEVVKAWRRTGSVPAGDLPEMQARRLVAQRCLYGVDKNPYAVDLAKLSLWLVTLSKDLPFTFLDHALRHGDSLVGLDFEQIKSGHWKPGKQVELAEVAVREALEEAIAIRQGILDLASDTTPAAQREKERRTADADDALSHARLLGDLIVGAFFAHEKEKERDKERQRRVDAFVRWKKSAATEIDPQLVEWQDEIRARVPVFHWMLEFPEVFYAERPDPLDGDQVNRAAYMDAFVGNPPFMDKNTISSTLGERFIRWLQAVHAPSHGNADVSAHFFRLAEKLIGSHGTVGLIATNTIAQGDTRATGLAEILRRGCVVFCAITSLTWPGTANVAVSIVHFAQGNVKKRVACSLDGAVVAAINSSLKEGTEREPAARLEANRAFWYQGAKVYGTGFMLSPERRDELLDREPDLAPVIMPYIGGEELNSSPTQSFDRYVINFGQRTLEECKRWPTLLDIVTRVVRPERERAREDTADGAHRKKYWWQFAQPRPDLFAAIQPLRHCLVSSRHTKHLCFALQPTNRVFSEATNVFVFEAMTPFGVLQSRVHEGWARLLSSSMRSDLRYSASDCFETFPFPNPDPQAVVGPVESCAENLAARRSEYMAAENVGLTVTYNRLKDPQDRDARILRLREYHQALDRAVLDAYGWADIEVPPYCPLTDDDKKRLERFEDTIIDRLFELNAKRAAEERAFATAHTPAKRPAKKATRSKRGAANTQASLPGTDDEQT